jgi:hypothetical protein
MHELPFKHDLGAGGLGVFGKTTDQYRTLDYEVRPLERDRNDSSIHAQLESLNPVDHRLLTQFSEHVSHPVRDDEGPGSRVDTVGALKELDSQAAAGQEERGKESRRRSADNRDIRLYALIRS